MKWIGSRIFITVLVVCSGMQLVGCPDMLFGMQIRDLPIEGLDRKYSLYVPPDVSDELLPLVIALHGFTQNGIGFSFVSQFHILAEQEKFMVAYPDGYRRSFNVGLFDGPDDVAFILAVIEDIAAEFPLDRDRIYITGASNGGFMTHLMACEAGDVFAAAAPIMATLPAEISRNCDLAAPLPMLLIHGTDDPIVSFDSERAVRFGGIQFDLLSALETVAFWVAMNGLKNAPEIEMIPDADPTDGTSTMLERYADDATEVLFYRVEGGGHTWPGTPAPGPYFLTGAVTQDFSATKVIWDFFQSHSRAGIRGDGTGGALGR